MPVINGSRGYVAYIAACFLGTLKAAFILLQSVCLTQRAGNKAWSDVVSPRLVCVYLFEKIEIALITAFKSLICFFAAKYLDCTLTNASVHTRGMSWEPDLAKTYFPQTGILCRPKRIPMLVLARPHQPIKQLRFLVVRPVFRALPAVEAVDGALLGLPPPFLHRRIAVSQLLALQRHLWRRRAPVGRAARRGAIGVRVDMLHVRMVRVDGRRRRGYAVLGSTVVGSRRP